MSSWAKQNLEGWQKRCGELEAALAASQERERVLTEANGKLREALEAMPCKCKRGHEEFYPRCSGSMLKYWWKR